MSETYSFGEWVKQRRKAQHLTQGQLALGANCAVATIKKIEADERRPSPELAASLANALRLPTNWRERFIESARGRRLVETLPSPSEDQIEKASGGEGTAPAAQQDDSSRLPTGTVTFLFTDIEGSSRLWEQQPHSMRQAMAAHDGLLQEAVTKNGGHVVKMRGDGLHAVFASAADALKAAAAGQRALRMGAWDESIGQLQVRMGLHTGTAELRDGDYYGPAVNRAARLQEAGHGGQVLLSLVTAGLTRDQLDGGITLRDLGLYQIKDAPQPEHVFQLVGANLRADFPPLRAQSSKRGNLPTSSTSFIGREREKARAKQLLSQTRLVTLIGPGGTGKTRLSLQVAAELQAQYRDGAWLVELAPLTDESMILPAIAEVFSLQSQQNRPLSDVLVDFFRAKEMLLIMDNCEHLIERCAVLAETFLDEAPEMRILASSRESLGIAGELILRVPSLTLPDNTEVTPETLQSSEAACLLVERAHVVRPEFQLNDENAGAVAEICRRLDGIPLAIELAAARLRLFSPQQIAARLGDRFRLLTGGSRTAVPRQQTLQALIDWSYDLLDPEEAELFRCLSVFAGGWTFEAAEKIGEGLDVMTLLDQLVNKSLVIVDDGENAVRYRFLETIRQYARDRLYATGEGETVRDRHFAYFSSLAAEAELYMGGRRSEELITNLSPETDNIRQSIEWGLERDPMATVDLLVGALAFWGQHSGPPFNEVSQWVQNVMKRLKGLTEDGWNEHQRQQTWARAHMLAGQAALLAGEFEKMRIHLTKAIDLARSLDDKHTLMTSLAYLSIMSAATRGAPDADDEAAYAAAEEGLALARKLGFRYYESIALNILGGTEVARGNRELGETLLAEAARGSHYTAAVAQFQTAMMMAYGLVDFEAALSYLEEARHRFQQLNHAHFLTLTTSEIAHIQRRTGDYAAAKAAYQDTIVHFQWLGSRPAIAHQLECFAFIAVAEEKWQRAARLLGAAEALRELINVEMLPREREEYDQTVAAVRRHIDGKKLELIWNAGRAMAMDQAIAYALADSE